MIKNADFQKMEIIPEFILKFEEKPK